MKCIIPGANIKVFGKAIHSLAKIGEELYLEPLEHGLALRTVNSSRSAYACFLFAPSFFHHYDDGSDAETAADSDDNQLRCKVGIKSCLTVFKSLATLEKTVDKCKVTLNMEEARLVFQLYCRHGIVKTHNLSFIECERLQAIFSKELCPNALVSYSKLLSESVMNFQNNQEEVTLAINPEKVTLRNYVDDEPDPQKVIHTELSLVPDEFEEYQVGVDTEVTFCLKELRAILSFSEGPNLPVAIHFEGPGKPIVFSLDSDPAFEGNFVLATLADNVTQTSAPETLSQMRNRSRNQSSHISQTTPAVSKTRRPTSINKSRSLCNGQERNQPQASTSHERSGPPPRKRKSDRLEAAYEELMSDDLDATLAQMGDIPSKADNRLQPQQDGDDDSPVIPMQSTTHVVKNATSGAVSDQQMAEAASDSDLTEPEDDVIMGTPPKKKFKSLFMGLSQSTTGGSQPCKQVLAEDTDDEDSS